MAWEALLRFIALSAIFLICQVAAAETVQVKYHGAVSLDAFACSEVSAGYQDHRHDTGHNVCSVIELCES